MSDETPNVIVITPADKVDFPAWYYGPKGESEIFESAGDVPEGWQDHPPKPKSKAKAATPAPKAEVVAAVATATADDELDALELDALEAILIELGFTADGASREDIITVIREERAKS